MSSQVETLTAVIVGIGFILAIVATADPKWQVTDPTTVISEHMGQYIGLWMECESDLSGNWICDDFDSFFLGLASHIQGGRAFTLTGCIVGFIACILCITSISSMPCTSQCSRTRNRVRLVGCGLALFGALCFIISAVWWIDVTSRQYYRYYYGGTMDGTRYRLLVFGEGIFIAIACGIFWIVGAILGACVSCGKRNETSYREVYHHRPEFHRDPEYV